MYVSVTCFLIPIPYFPHAQPWRRMFLFFAGFSAARQHCSSAALHLICMSGLHTMYVVCSRIHICSKWLPAVHVSPSMDPSTLVPTNATHAPIQSSVLSSTHFLFYSNFSLSTNYSCPLWNFPTIHSCAPSIHPYPYTRTHILTYLSSTTHHHLWTSVKLHFVFCRITASQFFPWRILRRLRQIPACQSMLIIFLVWCSWVRSAKC